MQRKFSLKSSKCTSSQVNPQIRPTASACFTVCLYRLGHDLRSDTQTIENVQKFVLRACSLQTNAEQLKKGGLLTEPEAVGVPGWQTGAKALCLYSQSPQACKPIRRAPTWLTTALVEWNALHTILAPGVWQTLCQSQCPC